jgi:hypothetical protein
MAPRRGPDATPSRVKRGHEWRAGLSEVGLNQVVWDVIQPGQGAFSHFSFFFLVTFAEGSKAGPDQEIPGPPNRDPDSRFRPNRESGIPCFPIPAESGSESPDFPKKPGNRGNRESDFLSDEYQLQWTRNILSREYHASAFTGSMRLLFRVRDSEREHAAVSDEHQLQ